MTTVAAMPIYGKNLKKTSPPEPIHEWYVALCTQVLPRVFKL